MNADAVLAFPIAAEQLRTWPQRYAANGKRINPGRGTGFSHFDPLPLKFLARVDVRGPEECWPWTGYIAPTGYGTITPRYAHRMAWEYARGPIPGDMTIDHLCFNPPCVNPAHLQLLTMSVNSSWQRAFRKTHCKAGHDLGIAENVYWNRSGGRTCRPCAMRRGDEQREKKRAERQGHAA